MGNSGLWNNCKPGHWEEATQGLPPISPSKAEVWLNKDISQKYEPRVRALVKVPLSEDSMGALVSFAYNVGTGALARSTLLKKVNAKDWDAVPGQFMRWNKSNGRVFRGLTRRRNAESKQFMEGLAHKPAERPPAVELPLPQRNPKRRQGATSWLLKAFLSWFR